MSIQLSDAIDLDLATPAWNERPEGWRLADFGDLLAYVSPDCSDILGEIYEDVDTSSTKVIPMAGLVVRPSESRSWDFRPFGQSLAVRKHRIERSYLRLNAWKVSCGMLSRKGQKAAKRNSLIGQ